MSRRKGDAWKHRPHHRAFAALSVAARHCALAGFRANQPTTTIVGTIAKEHGEVIPVSSLNRYREWWETAERPVLEAADKTEELLQAFKDHPSAELESIIRQLLQAQRLSAMTEDRKADPIKLGFLDIEERRLRLKERELGLRERALEQRVSKTADKVDKLVKRKLDEETAERIRTEIYGLAPKKGAA